VGGGGGGHSNGYFLTGNMCWHCVDTLSMVQCDIQVKSAFDSSKIRGSYSARLRLKKMSLCHMIN
ncbi:hypothetical protein, partial [Janthinobacterium lividum]|uniref:hypothetical protein n=1 Tax=Janthinobacterium lividum TaxID=29581 RepID=UPI00196A260C